MQTGLVAHYVGTARATGQRSKLHAPVIEGVEMWRRAANISIWLTSHVCVRKMHETLEELE